MIIQDEIAKWKVEGTIRELRRIRGKLEDDSYVSKTNKEIYDLIDDLNRFIGTAAAAPMNGKIEALREPSTGCDSDLVNVRHFINKEINYLKKDLDDYEGCQCGR